MAAEERVRLVLYVIGRTPVSLRAIENIQAMCGQLLGDGYELEIVDLAETPERAEDAGILATPALVKEHPLPSVRVVGDLSQADAVLETLGITPQGQGGQDP